MRIALIAVAGLVGLVAVVALIGALLPVKHHVTREATVPAPAESVFALLTAPLDFPRWRTGVTRVEMLPSVGGLPSYIEHSSNGTITYAVTRSVPGVELVTAIADKSLPFGGTWTYELIPAGGHATTLRITEDGEVYNVIFRFMSRFVFGHAATIERYLKDVQKRV